MKKITILANMFLCCVTCLILCAVPLHASEHIQVVVSIPPQEYFVNQVGGDDVKVMSMLPEGGFPHTFEPKAKQMKIISSADLYIRNHVEFEDSWWERIRSANPDMYVVDSTAGIEFLKGSAHHHHEEGDHHEGESHIPGSRDPHTWLSPKLVKIQAKAICEGLIHVDPEHKETYRRNTEQFLNELDTLDQDIQKTLTDLNTRTFMVFHPSWSYFARDYNLEQIPVEVEGKEPSASEMVQLMKKAKRENIQVIFVQPQINRMSADTIARQIGASVEILDPLARDWLANMRRVADALSENLR